MPIFPYSKLSEELKARADKYVGTAFLTFVKPVLPDFTRFAIGVFGDIDELTAEGWLVIDRTR